MLIGDVCLQKARRARVQRTFARFAFPLVLGLIAWLAPSEAHAYTWMIKHGYATCPACHADPLGGELLTSYGRSVGGSELSTRWGGGGTPSASWFRGKTDAAQGPEEVELEEDAEAEDEPKAKAKDKAKNKGKDKAAAKAAEGEEAADEEAAPEGEAAASEAPAEEAAAEAEASAGAEASGAGEQGFSSTAGFLWGLINTPDWLLLGGSFRYLNIY